MLRLRRLPLSLVAAVCLCATPAKAQQMCFGEFQTLAPELSPEERDRVRLEVEHEREAARLSAVPASVAQPAHPSAPQSTKGESAPARVSPP